MPRPYEPSLHDRGPSDLLQFVFVEAAPAAKGKKYVLMLKYDYSSKCWLIAFTKTMADNASCTVID